MVAYIDLALAIIGIALLIALPIIARKGSS
jgi:hypothetical protein